MTETRGTTSTRHDTLIHGRLLRYIACVRRLGPVPCAPSLSSLSSVMAAFTVKATYRTETRKFSFSDNVFPTYDQLYKQVRSMQSLTTPSSVLTLASL